MRRYRLLLILMLASVLAVSAHAAITGVISGTVTDTTGAVVPKVTVVATEQATGVKHTVITDSRGFFSFPSLDVGTLHCQRIDSGL